MAENKTKATVKSVTAFIAAVEPELRRADARSMVAIYKRATGFKPVLWGPSIIGFGSYHYVYPSGREGDMPLAAFSPRKNALVLYFSGLPGKAEWLELLGVKKISKGCVYVRRLADIDKVVLEKMIKASVKWLQMNHG